MDEHTPQDIPPALDPATEMERQAPLINDDMSTDSDDETTPHAGIASLYEAQGSPEQDGAPPPKPKSALREAISWVSCILIALVAAITIRMFIFEFIRVDGESMMPTLMHGQHLFVWKLNYHFSDPDRFDVVICKYPGSDDYYVKRVVGLPGEMIAIHDGKVWINGQALQEDFLAVTTDYVMEAERIGEDQVFVLGDNRNHSHDSHVLGPIQLDQIIGHAVAVAWPLNDFKVIRQ